MAATSNLIWPQGQDLHLKLQYKEGNTTETATALDLTSGYSVRMDIVDPTGAIVHVFNSDDILDTDPITVGAQADTQDEIDFANGAGGWNIDAKISRTLTLPGGTIYTKMTGAPPVLTFFGDVFLRNIAADEQWKILTVNITIEKSYTLWL